MFYTLYKTTNKVNGKFYIGVHKTKNPLDDYLGSGKYLKRAIGKYGRKNFIKEIINIFDNPHDAFLAEASIVTKELVENKLCYNVKIGGYGGFDYINSLDMSDRNIKISKIRNYDDPVYRKNMSNIITEKYKHDKNMGFRSGTNFDWTGMKHSERTKKKISDSRKQNNIGVGHNHSQYGTMWITDGKINRKIKNIDIIPTGWYKGRTM